MKKKGIWGVRRGLGLGESSFMESEYRVIKG